MAEEEVDKETVQPGVSYSVALSQQQRDDAVKGVDSQIKTIDDWMAENPQETAEEAKKRERRERSKRIVAAISDGISALSNLYFTSQYAPNQKMEDGGALKTVDDRIEKMKAERQANADKYLQFSLKKGALENERARTLRELEAEHEKLRLARQKAQREQEAHDWEAALQPDKKRELKGKADKAENDAKISALEYENKPESLRLDNEVKSARIKQSNAAANASNAAANASNAAANSRKGEFYAWDENGKEHQFRTKEAADSFAKQHGTYREVDIEETSETSKRRGTGLVTDSKTTTKKKGGYAVKPDPTGMPDPTE